MIPTTQYAAILDKFRFDVPPVALKFSAIRPNKVQRLAEEMAFCEMILQYRGS